ncbi:dUTP diphosphatase [Zavarzinia sp. CC-PAN008]|uniref:dUTP diphosphatase n=1 Tax=Zavarzinia sp. CC-PAN008 TaxID=3243332 RepID=UPI003F74879A
MTPTAITPTIRFCLARSDAADHGARIPVQAHEGASAGFDLHACLEAAVTLPGADAQPFRIPTGLRVQIPLGFCGLLVPRSSTGEKGLRLANTVGIIDSDYRGEILVSATTARPGVVVAPGDRIAQLVIVPVPTLHVEVVDSLDDSPRGAGGFGSTGA